MNVPGPRAPQVDARVPARVARLQHAVASGLGVDEGRRTDTVVGMLANNARRAPGYWIQLFLAMGIATLGLALDSTAVVIGAMLVSPLMGPIIELGMGFAVGSSLLVLRASLRVVLSVAVVVTGSALLVLMLPFHEVTSEIATRTAPTALDLLVAVFCGLTAAYTTVRPGSDTTAAAAGTAIGIALVPPLCTVGFGLGTGAGEIAGGAALLFTANLSAIVVLAVLSFLLLGFNQVDAGGVERDFVGPDGTLTRRWAGLAHRALGRMFGSRYGFAMRIAIPVLFLAAVFVPLRRALDEVTWEVRARDAVRRIVQEESPRAMQTSLVVERHTLSLRLLVVGTTASPAGRLERRLTTRLTSATGVVPHVAIVAVPDEQRLLSAAAAEGHLTSVAEPVPDSSVRARAAAAIAAEWPSAAGTLLGWELNLSPTDSLTLLVRHLGDPLLGVGEALFGRALGARLDAPVRILDAAIPAGTLVADRGRVTRWRDLAQARLGLLSPADSAVVACVSGPVVSTRPTSTADRTTLKALQSTLAAQAGRLVVIDSAQWTLRLAAGRCTSAPNEATGSAIPTSAPRR